MTDKIIPFCTLPSRSLRSFADRWSHRVEFFTNSVPDSTGYGEGETFLGFETVTTDALGNATFSFTPSVPLAYGQFITATATDTLHNNTSEFSPLLVAGTKTKIYGDHYVVNTTLSGIPLHWADGNASYRISTTNLPADPPFASKIDQGFATWNGLEDLHYTAGPTDTSTVWGGNPDGINNVVYIPGAQWESVTNADPQALAERRVCTQHC